MNALAAPPPGQINLYNAALLPRREHFAAHHIAAGVLVAAIGMSAIAWWAAGQLGTLRREVAEQERLLAAQTAQAMAPPTIEGQPVPSPQQVAALEQALRSKQAALEARRAARDELEHGMAGVDRGPSALMRMIATTIPQEAWLTGLRAVGPRVEVTGKALEPAAVDEWLGRMRASRLLAEQPQPTVRAERIEMPTPGGRAMAAYAFTITAPLAAPLADEGARP